MVTKIRAISNRTSARRFLDFQGLLCYLFSMPLVPEYIASLQPYKPGRPIDEVKREFGLSRVIKLASNENPLGPSPRALEELTKHFGGLHYYPNGGADLRAVLAAKYNLKIENVIAGSGSEGIMSNIIRTFLCDD